MEKQFVQEVAMSERFSFLRPARSRNCRFPEWEPVYQAAVLELDPHKLAAGIKLAEEQITRRLQTLRDGDQHAEERQAIFEARNFLRSLRNVAMKHLADE
jgi:hypothetical protein